MKNEDFIVAILILISWNMAPGVNPSSPSARSAPGNTARPLHRTTCLYGSSYAVNAAACKGDSSLAGMDSTQAAAAERTRIFHPCLRIRGGHGNEMVLDGRGHTFLPEEEEDVLGRDALDELQRVKDEREMLRKRHDRFTDSVGQVRC